MFFHKKSSDLNTMRRVLQAPTQRPCFFSNHCPIENLFSLRTITHRATVYNRKYKIRPPPKKLYYLEKHVAFSASLSAEGPTEHDHAPAFTVWFEQNQLHSWVDLQVHATDHMKVLPLQMPNIYQFVSFELENQATRISHSLGSHEDERMVFALDTKASFEVDFTVNIKNSFNNPRQGKRVHVSEYPVFLLWKSNISLTKREPIFFIMLPGKPENITLENMNNHKASFFLAWEQNILENYTSIFIDTFADMMTDEGDTCFFLLPCPPETISSKSKCLVGPFHHLHYSGGSEGPRQHSFWYFEKAPFMECETTKGKTARSDRHTLHGRVEAYLERYSRRCYIRADCVHIQHPKHKLKFIIMHSLASQTFNYATRRECYKPIISKVSWLEAYMLCSALPGHTLPIIRSSEEQQDLIHMLKFSAGLPPIEVVFLGFIWNPKVLCENTCM